MSIGHHVEGSAPASRPVRPVDIPALIASKFVKPEGQCRMFLRCLREATTHIDHPILGEVKVCDEHQIWYEELS